MTAAAAALIEQYFSPGSILTLGGSRNDCANAASNLAGMTSAREEQRGRGDASMSRRVDHQDRPKAASTVEYGMAFAAGDSDPGTGWNCIAPRSRDGAEEVGRRDLDEPSGSRRADLRLALEEVWGQQGQRRRSPGG
eukprot:CAMPEP_0195596582 /NCGR_PEP_ID=MMETSP0815-20121206/2535_1 /TAXON_ID=97485 /ORGANISM="Prymnesium parvum, Strain Texoma1" /LENGTH=136 /DNA_ID=CAMNT_0040735879 /DNA_START=311 /DNA_END=722 /DNA_ORIENTATION=-